MSKGLSQDTQTDTTDQTALENESVATAQEAIPVPLFAGKVKLAGRFCSPIYGQYAQQSKTTSQSKK